MNRVEYRYSDDSFVHAESALRRAIGQHAARNRWIYIGLTQQVPEHRFAQHQWKWADPSPVVLSNDLDPMGVLLPTRRPTR